MINVKRFVLDVLKPHQPNGLEFASNIAEKTNGAQVRLTVSGVDEKTETVVIDISGADLHYDSIVDVISAMGGSVHSVDEVEVENCPSDPD